MCGRKNTHKMYFLSKYPSKRCKCQWFYMEIVVLLIILSVVWSHVQNGFAFFEEEDDDDACERKVSLPLRFPAFFRMIIDHFLIINVNEQILYYPPLWMLHVFRNDFCPKELHRKWTTKLLAWRWFYIRCQTPTHNTFRQGGNLRGIWLASNVHIKVCFMFLIYDFTAVLIPDMWCIFRKSEKTFPNLISVDICHFSFPILSVTNWQFLIWVFTLF